MIHRTRAGRRRCWSSPPAGTRSARGPNRDLHEEDPWDADSSAPSVPCRQGGFQARYRDAAGDQVSAPDTFESRAVASQWLAALQTDMERGAYTDPTAGAVTFADWAEDWMGFKAGQRPATLARDRTAIYVHFNPLIGDLPVGLVTPMDVRRLVQRMQERGLAAKSVRTYVGPCRRSSLRRWIWT